MTAPRRIYIIAGEPSGDRLGGALMTALAGHGPVAFRGIGGQEMTAAGLAPRFDMAELTVMGLTEVLPRLAHLMRRIRETAGDVADWRPDALVTIDSPSTSAPRWRAAIVSSTVDIPTRSAPRRRSISISAGVS